MSLTSGGTALKPLRRGGRRAGSAGSAVDLPAALDCESVVVDDEHAAGRVAVRIAERTHVDPIGTAVDGVRPAVAGAVGDLLGLDRVDELRLLRIGLDVEDVDARRAKARHQ